MREFVGCALRGAAVGLAAGGLLVSTSVTARPRTISQARLNRPAVSAQRIEVVNDDGRAVVIFESADDGGARISLVDKRGVARGVLSAAGLSLSGGGKVETASGKLTLTDVPQLQLYTTYGSESRDTITLAPGRSPSLQIVGGATFQAP
ncbi:MAG: hypothetical protein FJX76_05005 [Armatimonadetes bacterium]|nr:hypothetical protein [Armatimonadota bacterium]